MAGGVALNCVVNGKLLNKNFKNIWIQPASGDAGGSIGAALGFYYLEKNKRFVNKEDSMKGALLGPSFSNKEIKKILDNERAIYKYFPENELIKKTVNELIDGKTVAWFQGRMEFGPRSLGNRSILADPQNPSIQKT